MSILIVTNNPKDWPFAIPNVEVVEARSYLTRPEYSDLRGAKVFNLCRSYRYQSNGYYVSLLAEARGHKPMPSVTTIQDIKSQSVVRFVGDDLDDLIQHSFASLQSDRFTLSVYFGRNLAKKYDRLSMALFNMFPAPMLRSEYVKDDKGRWELRGVATMPASEVPIAHREFVAECARDYFAGRRGARPSKKRYRYDLAILFNPDDPEGPSNEKSIGKFLKAADRVGLSAEIIGREDAARLPQFDALFIRETTYVNHYTYRFARRGVAEGLVVIDDPVSIARCTNKVYLAELMQRHGLPIPKTVLVHRDNDESITSEIGFPCVLKKPDSAFSRGVVKVTNAEEWDEQVRQLLAESDLVVAQEFLPTPFDWRIAILDRQPLFACKYFMAQNHWQIINKDDNGNDRYGKFETIPVELAPRNVTRLALKAANLIGDGLYGVDVKQVDDKPYIIEINDNPNIDAGVEDQILRDELYHRVMSVFLKRIEQQKAGWPDR